MSSTFRIDPVWSLRSTCSAALWCKHLHQNSLDPFSPGQCSDPCPHLSSLSIATEVILSGQLTPVPLLKCCKGSHFTQSQDHHGGLGAPTKSVPTPHDLADLVFHPNSVSAAPLFTDHTSLFLLLCTLNHFFCLPGALTSLRNPLPSCKFFT